MKLSHLFLTIISLLASSLTVLSQREEPRTRNQAQPAVMFEAHNFVSREIGKSRLDVSFSVPYEFFIFVKNGENSNESPFVATSEISIDLLGKDHTPIAHKFLRTRLGVNQPQSDSLEHQFVEGMVSFNVPPGDYSLSIEALDQESNRRFTNKPRNVTLKNFSLEKRQFSDVVFFRSLPGTSTQSLSPVNSGGDVPFGKDIIGYTELTGNVSDKSQGLHLVLLKLGPEPENRIVVMRDSLPNNSFASSKRMGIIEQGETCAYIMSDSVLPKVYACWFHIKGDTLSEGDYELELSTSGEYPPITTKQHFSIRWFDMPKSLRSPQLAIDALEYIAQESELRRMRDADTQTQHLLIEDFWKRRITSYGVPYHVAMAEYYKRVDYAFRAFGTVRKMNGVKTDRGKVYILYGPPTSVDRDLSPDSGPKEYWSYQNLHKKFTFADETRSGDYKLSSAQNF